MNAVPQLSFSPKPWPMSNRSAASLDGHTFWGPKRLLAPTGPVVVDLGAGRGRPEQQGILRLFENAASLAMHTRALVLFLASTEDLSTDAQHLLFDVVDDLRAIGNTGTCETCRAMARAGLRYCDDCLAAEAEADLQFSDGHTEFEARRAEARADNDEGDDR